MLVLLLAGVAVAEALALLAVAVHGRRRRHRAITRTIAHAHAEELQHLGLDVAKVPEHHRHRAVTARAERHLDALGLKRPTDLDARVRCPPPR